jgi:hypothetical protein
LRFDEDFNEGEQAREDDDEFAFPEPAPAPKAAVPGRKVLRASGRNDKIKDNKKKYEEKLAALKAAQEAKEEEEKRQEEKAAREKKEALEKEGAMQIGVLAKFNLAPTNVLAQYHRQPQEDDDEVPRTQPRLTSPKQKEPSQGDPLLVAVAEDGDEEEEEEKGC